MITADVVWEQMMKEVNSPETGPETHERLGVQASEILDRMVELGKTPKEAACIVGGICVGLELGAKGGQS